MVVVRKICPRSLPLFAPSPSFDGCPEGARLIFQNSPVHQKGIYILGFRLESGIFVLSKSNESNTAAGLTSSTPFCAIDHHRFACHGIVYLLLLQAFWAGCGHFRRSIWSQHPSTFLSTYPDPHLVHDPFFHRRHS